MRQFYIALWRGHIDGWSLERFEEATGLKLTYEGNLREELPPMPQFLNRLLALPICEQNALFAALETRIEANIEHAVEAGTFERGVETIAADSLSVASRETVFVHEGSDAETEIVEIARRDRLEPITADGALGLHADASGRRPRLMVNAQSKPAALVVPAPSRMFDDGGVEIRIVFGGMDGYVPTALVALTLDDAERLCDRLNARLGLDHTGRFPSAPSTPSPPRERTPSFGTASCQASGFRSIPRAPRSLSSRPDSRESRRGLASDGTRSFLQTRHAARRPRSSPVSRPARTLYPLVPRR